MCYLVFSFEAIHLKPFERKRRRRPGTYHMPVNMTSEGATPIPSYDSIVCEEDIKQLVDRLQVDRPIIIFNLLRLYRHYETIHRLYAYYRWSVLEDRRDLPATQTTLSSEQMVVLLEFFLQIDGRCLTFSFYYTRTVLVHLSRFILHENMFISWCTTTIRK